MTSMEQEQSLRLQCASQNVVVGSNDDNSDNAAISTAVTTNTTDIMFQHDELSTLHPNSNNDENLVPVDFEQPSSSILQDSEQLSSIPSESKTRSASRENQRTNSRHRNNSSSSSTSCSISNSNNHCNVNTAHGGGGGNHSHSSSMNVGGNTSGPSNAIRRVTRVSRHAAMTTKQAVWDSNELSIDAALSAVDQWESAYTAFRSLLVHTVVSARGLYGTAKDGAGKLEHGLLMPVRDWILLPAFTGAERAVAETTKFLQSPAARHLAHGTLQLASSVPVVGENVLAPAMRLSVAAVQRTWDVMQYPIPSREQVRSSVDWSLTGTKWALTAAAREVFLYAKRADANITRTLSHTQWKVLGSGPYATLDPSNRAFVIDHSCERYFAQSTDVARYELAAHIKRHNPTLYSDLVVTGLLKERGGDITEYDEWLSPNPIYRDQVWTDVIPFLLPKHEHSKDTPPDTSSKKKKTRGDLCLQQEVSALWFRWPQVNGKPPAKDAPWMCFRKSEQRTLERKYRQVVQDHDVAMSIDAKKLFSNNCTVQDEDLDVVVNVDTDTTVLDDTLNRNTTPKQTNRARQQNQNRVSIKRSMHAPPTIAQWYVADPETDVMVDQQRHAVTFSVCCPKCREAYTTVDTGFSPMANVPSRYGDECEACHRLSVPSFEYNNDETSATPGSQSSSIFAPPPIATVMRPNFWRFYGNGDDVRRATWFLDTARNGLQPFDCDAQAVLEDAYLFLKWLSYRRTIDPDKKKTLPENGVGDASLDESLLTVEVLGPDGTDRLVQFSSLTQATAIQKGLGAAIAIFKRRVYRGAWLESITQRDDENGEDDICDINENNNPNPSQPNEMSLMLQNENNMTLSETLVSDESLRSLLIPPVPITIPDNRLARHGKSSVEEDDEVVAEEAESLAVPRARLTSSDMAKQLRDERDGTVDHLCLIVHGIGEMMRSMDLFGLTLPNLSSVCGSMRSNHAEVQAEHIPQMYPTADLLSSSSTATTGRVEYLPVEWHEAFSILTQRRAPESNIVGSSNGILGKSKDAPRNVMIEDISLKTIPNMREFANDTLMDVLFFMSPEHHQIIIDVVTHEMNLGTNEFPLFYSKVTSSSC
jgi:hypothetical protein